MSLWNLPGVVHPGVVACNLYLIFSEQNKPVRFAHVSFEIQYKYVKSANEGLVHLLGSSTSVKIDMREVKSNLGKLCPSMRLNLAFKKCHFPQLQIEPNVGTSRHIIHHDIIIWFSGVPTSNGELAKSKFAWQFYLSIIMVQIQQPGKDFSIYWESWFAGETPEDPPQLCGALSIYFMLSVVKKQN
jgi:hypothetical protein